MRVLFYAMKTILWGLSVFALAILLGACSGKSHDDHTSYTKIDSLTDTYLLLKDSMLNTWNRMMYDDNKRIKTMKAILHELKVTRETDDELWQSLDYRIDQLHRIRFTQKTMTNTDVVEEYDFASNSLVTEISALAESIPSYAYNSTLQQLVERLRLADQRIEVHRADYDAAAQAYNQFIEANKPILKEIDQSATFDKKPLFYPVSE
ncbi:MAG: LemA family protein [Cyclobacteriaceae bacterium]|nr:LemA family protein [Cyclobacteriaceae bacterium]